MKVKLSYYCPQIIKAKFSKSLKNLAETIKTEQKKQDPNLEIIIEETGLPNNIMREEDRDRLIKAVYAAITGCIE